MYYYCIHFVVEETGAWKMTKYTLGDGRGKKIELGPEAMLTALI